jgi:hypothetical protein
MVLLVILVALLPDAEEEDASSSAVWMSVVVATTATTGGLMMRFFFLLSSVVVVASLLLSLSLLWLGLLVLVMDLTIPPGNSGASPTSSQFLGVVLWTWSSNQKLRAARQQRMANPATFLLLRLVAHIGGDVKVIHRSIDAIP